MKELSIIIPEEFTYTKRYYSHFISMKKSSLPAFGRALFGVVFGDCAWKKTCEGTYNELAERMNCSRATVARSMKRLNDGGMIERVEGKRSEYTTSKSKKEGYVLTPDFFYTMTPTFKSGETRKLRPTEIDVLSFVLSWTLNNTMKGYVGSVGNMARTLGMRSTTTATEAIEALVRCELIFRNNTKHTINGQDIYKYVANSELVLAMRKAFAKNKDDVDFTPKAIKDLNALAERDRFYSKLRAKAEKEAEQKQHRLFVDSEYALAYRERRDLDLSVAKTDNGAKVEEIERRRVALWNKMITRAHVLGVPAEDLTPTGNVAPKYRCDKCNDTGDRISDGIACDCYVWRRRL